MEYLTALAVKSLLIASSSDVSSRSDIPSSAVAAPAGEPLKNTRTTSLRAVLRATLSATAGLYT